MVVKTFTTLGATFFTTGAKLVMALPSRWSGVLSTCTLTGGCFGSSFACAYLVHNRPEPHRMSDPPSNRVLSRAAIGLFSLIRLVGSSVGSSFLVRYISQSDTHM